MIEHPASETNDGRSSSPGYEESAGIRPPSFRLPPSTHIGRVKLAVSQLERSVAFYTEVIGLHLVRRDDRIASLGTRDNARVLLELEEVPGVHAFGRRTRLGLYHVAFLLPNRAALGSFLRHLLDLRMEFGAGDHLVSEALYLVDPDGISVEVYADLNRDKWRVSNGELMIGTRAVKSAEILASAGEPWSGVPPGTSVGHVHLYVDELEAASAFYHAALGLDLMTWRIPGALFLGAGGYHHHVGLNIWAAGSPVAGESDARLLSWELVLPDERATTEAAESCVELDSEARWMRTERGHSLTPWG